MKQKPKLVSEREYVEMLRDFVYEKVEGIENVAAFSLATMIILVGVIKASTKDEGRRDLLFANTLERMKEFYDVPE